MARHFQWMIDGCVDWQRGGLKPPQAVIDATAAYLDDEDAIAAWIHANANTTLMPGNNQATSSPLGPPGPNGLANMSVPREICAGTGKPGVSARTQELRSWICRTSARSNKRRALLESRTGDACDAKTDSRRHARARTVYMGRPVTSVTHAPTPAMGLRPLFQWSVATVPARL